MLLPSQTFFTPTEQFMQLLQNFKDYRIIDCGCGMGTMIDHGKEYGLKIEGIDLFRREGQHPEVVIGDAFDIPWDEKTLALMCRPDHSGWVGELGEKLMANNSMGIYVSHQHNYPRDVGHLYARKLTRRAGTERETAYLVSTKSRHHQIATAFRL